MKTSHMYSIIAPVSVGRDPTPAGDMPPGRNPMCVVCTLAAREVETPSKRCAEDTIWSPLCAVFCRENRKKPQGKMSNLFLSHLYCSTVLPCSAPALSALSKSRRRPVIASDVVLGGLFSAAGKGVKFIIAVYRRISHAQSRRKNHAQSQVVTRFDALQRPFRVETH